MPAIRATHPGEGDGIHIFDRYDETGNLVHEIICGSESKKVGPWTEIDLQVINVAKFYVTAKISPGRIAEFEGEGHEWFKTELDLYLFELAGMCTVGIEMVDFAENELDPPYEVVVDGWFGGVLRMLEALWDSITVWVVCE